MIIHKVATLTPMKVSLLTTATDLVIFGDNSGAFTALDTDAGEVHWKYNGNQGWRASQMTYELDGRQYIAVTIGRSITAFALPEGMRVKPHSLTI